MNRTLSVWLAIAAFIGALTGGPARAADIEDSTNAAVTNILFENDADEFVGYSIRPDGWLDVTFARNTPDPVYSAILNKLQSHPDIRGVLAGRDGPTCGRF